MTYSSKGSKKTTFSLAYENVGSVEEVGPLPTKKLGETCTYELHESLRHVFLYVRSERNKRALMPSHCAKKSHGPGSKFAGATQEMSYRQVRTEV